MPRLARTPFRLKNRSKLWNSNNSVMNNTWLFNVKMRSKPWRRRERHLGLNCRSRVKHFICRELNSKTKRFKHNPILSPTLSLWGAVSQPGSKPVHWMPNSKVKLTLFWSKSWKSRLRSNKLSTTSLLRWTTANWESNPTTPKPEPKLKKIRNSSMRSIRNLTRNLIRWLPSSAYMTNNRPPFWTNKRLICISAKRNCKLWLQSGCASNSLLLKLSKDGIQLSSSTAQEKSCASQPPSSTDTKDLFWIDSSEKILRVRDNKSRCQMVKKWFSWKETQKYSEKCWSISEATERWISSHFKTLTTTNCSWLSLKTGVLTCNMTHLDIKLTFPIQSRLLHKSHEVHMQPASNWNPHYSCLNQREDQCLNSATHQLLHQITTTDLIPSLLPTLPWQVSTSTPSWAKK